jgi:membrane associated rhomboid family serine protease
MEPGTSNINNGRIFTIVAIVCAVVAVAILPIIFGPLGIIFAVMGMRRGDPLGRTALIVAVIGMIAGFVLGAVFYTGSE